MRSLVIANLFGLTHAKPPLPQACSFTLPPECWKPGSITLINGPSGAGKSTLLRRLPSMQPGRWIDLDRIRWPHRPVIECFADMPLEKALQLLSRVGLAEARCYLSPPARLSTGQIWRFRLARGLYAAYRLKSPSFLVCDEFAAVLDRVTAMTVSHLLRRALSDPWWEHRTPPAVFLATSHDDLIEALDPDHRVICDFHHVRLRNRSAATQGVCQFSAAGETRYNRPVEKVKAPAFPLRDRIGLTKAP